MRRKRRRKRRAHVHKGKRRTDTDRPSLSMYERRARRERSERRKGSEWVGDPDEKGGTLHLLPLETVVIQPIKAHV